MEVPAIIAQDKDEYQIESCYAVLNYISFAGTRRYLSWDRSGRKKRGIIQKRMNRDLNVDFSDFSGLRILIRRLKIRGY